MAGNDTAALVVALSAQLTKFEKAMTDASNLSDRTAAGIEDRWSRINPVFSGSFLGNFASSLASSAMDKAIKFVEDLKDRFIDLQSTAHLVQVSMNDIFGIQQAASKSGASIDDVTKSVRSLATLLDQMKRGDQNSLSALFDANPQALQGVNRDALTLQQTFALVADLVQNARTEIQKIDISQAAGQADSMVKFLQQGGDAVTRLSKAAADSAPDLQKIADKAKEFDDAWKAAVEHIKAYLSENLPSAFDATLNEIVSIIDLVQKFLGLFKGGLLSDQAAEASEAWNKLKVAIQNVNAEGVKAGKVERQPLGPPGGGTSTRNPNRPLSNVPPKSTGGSDEEDAFDRTAEQITKHTASINADTAAINQNNAARAQLRAEFTLLNALRKDDAGVTQDQIDQYEKLRTSMSAEQALEQAHINLSPAHKAAFIAASEGAKTATGNYDAARDSLNKLNSASQQFGSSLATAFSDAVVNGKSLSEVLSSLLKTLASSSINSLFGQFFNAPSSGGLSPFANLVSGIIPKFADGTDFAPGGPAIVGENGPEILNLPRGSQIVPNNIARRATASSIVLSPTYQVDARGSTLGEAQLRNILAANNAALMSQVNKSLPGMLADNQARRG